MNGSNGSGEKLALVAKPTVLSKSSITYSREFMMPGFMVASVIK